MSAPTLKPQIAASLLAADLHRLGEAVREAAAAGIRWFHVDIMDGHFVPPISFGDNMVRLVKQCAPQARCDVHLMVEKPERQIHGMLQAGADIVTFHPETTRRAYQCIADIRAAGAQAGLALSPGAPLALAEALLDRLDLLLVMTVEPGFGGQQMIEGMLGKTRQAKQLLAERNQELPVQVDGGVNADTAGRLRAAGADIFVAGSGLFGAGDVAASYQALRRSIGL